MEPGEGAFDYPADAAESGAVRALPPRDLGRDPAPAELAPVLVVVVAAVGGEAFGATARTADLAANGRHALDQRHELGDVVAVAARHRPSNRDRWRGYVHATPRAGSGSINRARARFGAPFFACTWLESATARDHSSSPAARS